MRNKLIRIMAIALTLSAVAYMGLSTGKVNAAAPVVAGSSSTAAGVSVGGIGVHEGEEFEDASATPGSGSAGGGGSGDGGSGDGVGADGKSCPGKGNYSGGGGGGGGCCG